MCDVYHRGVSSLWIRGYEREKAAQVGWHRVSQAGHVSPANTNHQHAISLAMNILIVQSVPQFRTYDGLHYSHSDADLENIGAHDPTVDEKLGSA